MAIIVATDFLCEKRLSQLNPHYHTLVKNTVFVMSRVLEKYKLFFPDFTDHTVLHSLQVLDFCNRLLGEQVLQLNEDELYVLIMSAYLHDSGMGISEPDYKALYDYVVSDEYRLNHPVDNIRETIRAFHQKFSRQYIYKYADLFEIPSEEHTRAIALVSEAHRKMDLLDENILPSVLTVPNGNEIHLPLLAALIRLADELDIAADRNIGFEPDGQETIFKLMHRSIRHLHILPERFVVDVAQDDPALFDGIQEEIDKLFETLQICSRTVAERTPFRIRQSTIEINRIAQHQKHITILDTDLGTDDACALFLLKNLPIKPDYIVASFGNTTLEGACRNAVILRKYLGLEAEIVKGLEPSNGSRQPNGEKNTFHGADGLANCSEKMIKKLKINQDELQNILPFGELCDRLSEYDSVTYITIGTLRNFAALLHDKEFCRKLRGAYIMGGGIREFNCSHNTEFNFSKDPESVKTVLTCGLNITLFPLDVTNRQVLTAEQIDELEAIGTYPEYISFLRHNRKANIEYNHISAAVLHDTLPILYLSHPELFKLEEMRIASNEYACIFPSANGEAVHICTEMKDGKLFEFMKSAFES
ncbi:MAG TPA: hypothetical protein DDY98_00880 [Ruminococcaceae bacterium]|nr:hypothetical protein [Oscillospiraceae bacterium]